MVSMFMVVIGSWILHCSNKFNHFYQSINIFVWNTKAIIVNVVDRGI